MAIYPGFVCLPFLMFSGLETGVNALSSLLKQQSNVLIGGFENGGPNQKLQFLDRIAIGRLGTN